MLRRSVRLWWVSIHYVSTARSLAFPDEMFTPSHARKLPLHQMLLRLRTRAQREVEAMLLYGVKETKFEQWPGNEGGLHYFSFTEYKITYCVNVFQFEMPWRSIIVKASKARSIECYCSGHIDIWSAWIGRTELWYRVCSCYFIASIPYFIKVRKAE